MTAVERTPPGPPSTASADELIQACLARYGQMMQALLHARVHAGLPWNEAHVTLPQLRVLSLLMGHERGLSGRQLAARLGVGPSAVTPLVDRLVEHGYVARAEDPADRRVTRLLLTPDGAAALQQFVAGRREVVARALHELDAEELSVVLRAFELVAGGARRAGGQVTDEPAATRCRPGCHPDSHGPAPPRPAAREEPG